MAGYPNYEPPSSDGLSESEVDSVIAAALTGVQGAGMVITTTTNYEATVDDRIIVTLGETVTLQPAADLLGQEVTVFAAGGGVTILPAVGDTIFGQASYSLPNAADGVHLAAADATAATGGFITTTWVVTLTAGPFVSLPDWAGKTQGYICAVNSDGNPAWLAPGTDGQVLVVNTGGVLNWTDPASLDIDASDISYTGSGLFADAVTPGQGINAAEGALDRWAFVSAYSTVNIDISTLTTTGGTQPEMDDGITPPATGSGFTDVWLFAQSTSSENGQYLVNGTTGVWTKYVEPNQFDPANGHRVTCLSNGAQFIWLDADLGKNRRASDFATTSTGSGTGAWWRLPDASTTLTVSP